jgi:hypothetical protein
MEGVECNFNIYQKTTLCKKYLVYDLEVSYVIKLNLHAQYKYAKVKSSS